MSSSSSSFIFNAVKWPKATQCFTTAWTHCYSFFHFVAWTLLNVSTFSNQVFSRRCTNWPKAKVNLPIFGVTKILCQTETTWCLCAKFANNAMIRTLVLKAIVQIVIPPKIKMLSEMEHVRNYSLDLTMASSLLLLRSQQSEKAKKGKEISVCIRAREEERERQNTMKWNCFISIIASITSNFNCMSIVTISDILMKVIDCIVAIKIQLFHLLGWNLQNLRARIWNALTLFHSIDWFLSWDFNRIQLNDIALLQMHTAVDFN